MQVFSRRFFTLAGVLAALAAAPAALASHANLNGTWVLNATRSNFAGEPVIETGTLTINDREHHIYIARTFNYDNAKGGFDYSFTTDGEENSTIRKGESFKSKAKWDGDNLKVTTTRDGLTTIEHFSLAADGTLILMLDRPNHSAETLVFQRK